MEAAVTEAVYSEDGAAFDDVTFTVGELFEIHTLSADWKC